MKAPTVMPGWSAVGGQTISPYTGPIEDGETLLGHSVCSHLPLPGPRSRTTTKTKKAPGGSSAGSAVAVAAGLSPLALGTETIGSIITPASRAALYAIKPTVGVQDTKGMYTLTDFFDSPGPMAKCVADLRALMEVLMPGLGFGTDDEKGWDGLAIGFLDPVVWKMGEGMCRDRGGAAGQMASIALPSGLFFSPD